MNTSALFLDRDGVVNVDHGFVFEKSNFEFIDGIFDLCLAANNNGYKIFIITNQSGIGRGYYSEYDFNKLNQWMLEIFKKNSIYIAETYYCASHPVYGLGKYKKDDFCRKPNPGMIIKAQKDHKIILSRSILIGDKLSDIHAGERAGIKCNILFNRGNSEVSENILSIRNLLEAMSYMKNVGIV